ncbi:MAG: zinc-binding dehydrogenase [Dehalococcoidia bacterium]
MKAVYIEAHGGPEVLTYGERPDPVIEPHEVKVRVHACALNRLDTYNRLGIRGRKREFPPPHIMGGDIAGEVAEVGSLVSGLQPGQRVVLDPRVTCGQCPFCLAREQDLCDSGKMLGSDLDGGYAEFVKVPAANCFPLPDQVPFEEAAAAPTTFLPMWNMLIRKAQLKPWETVLVLSASSGVGTAGIQVAKRVIGARVIATTSTPEKAAKARELGADEVIVYTNEDITQRALELTSGQGVDVVVDHVGAEFYPQAFATLKKGGRYGTCGVTTGHRAELHLGQLFSRRLTLFGVYMGNREEMRQIVAMLGRGVIRPSIDRVFPLEQAAEAHKMMDAPTYFGKLVLRVSGG